MELDQYEQLPEADKDVSLEKLISDFKQSQNAAPTEGDTDLGDPTPPASSEPPVNDKNDAPPEVNEPPAPTNQPPADKSPQTPEDAGKTQTPPGNEPPKNVQSPEDNARFAETRRQQQIEARVQEELAKRMQESPEMKLAKQLSETYGQPVETILAQVKEAQLQREAQAKQVPVELLRQQQTERERMTQQAAEQQKQLQDLQFQVWNTRVNSEKTTILNDYKGVLTPEDVDAAVEHMLVGLGNPNLPLDQVVFALHGKKITENLKEQARTEALAEVSGRAKTPVAPSGTKAGNAEVLSEDEKLMARMFKMTDTEYLKYKPQR